MSRRSVLTRGFQAFSRMHSLFFRNPRFQKRQAFQCSTTTSIKQIRINVGRLRRILVDAKEVIFSSERLNQEVRKHIESCEKEMLHINNKVMPNIGSHFFAKTLETHFTSSQEAFIQGLPALRALAKAGSTPEKDGKILDHVLAQVEKTYISSQLVTLDDLRSQKIRLFLEDALATISNSHLASGALSPTCFVSYAWGVSHEVERVHRIARDLRHAGIQIYLDIWHNKKGSIIHFTEELNSTDWVLLLASPQLNSKWKQMGNVVSNELKQISYRFRNEPNSIVTARVAGSHAEATPQFLIDEVSIDCQQGRTYPIVLLDDLLPIFYERTQLFQDPSVNQAIALFKERQDACWLAKDEEELDRLSEEFSEGAAKKKLSQF